MPRHVDDDLWEYLGPGALVTFVLATALALGGLLVPVFWRWRTVVAYARRDDRHRVDAILVLGQQLVDDEPTYAFLGRLEHAAALWRQRVAPLVIVAGGRTGASTVSEAAVGRAHLLSLGIPDGVILVEDRSRHTLENLFNVRRSLDERGLATVVIVSNPVHLARAAAIAGGLDLEVSCSGAPGTDPPRSTWGWRRGVFREAFMVHWYYTGMAYSRLTRSQRMLQRVT